MLQTTFAPLGAGDPFADMRRMQNTMNRLFNGISAPDRMSSYPPVNFWAGQNSVEMTTELPGLAEGNIELTVKGRMLSICGSYPEQETGVDIQWQRRERLAGSFLRSGRTAVPDRPRSHRGPPPERNSDCRDAAARRRQAEAHPNQGILRSRKNGGNHHTGTDNPRWPRGHARQC